MFRAFQGYKVVASALAFAGVVLAGALGISTAANADGDDTLDVITVRARATDQPLRDIPVAITAVSEATMDEYGLKNLSDIAAFTPGLEIIRISSGAGAEISVRGISSSASTIGIESSVSLILDGVYFPQSRVIFEGLFDSSQVAILKGPQALYFGKNATAGVVAIRTNDPGDEFEVLGKIGYEIEGQQLYGEAVMSAPINDKWGVRLAVAGSSMSQGYMENTAGASTYTTFDVATGALNPQANGAPKDRWMPGEESFYGRLTLKGDLSDVFTARLKASFADSKVNNANVSERYDCNALGGVAHVTGAGVDGDGNPIEVPLVATGVACDSNRAAGQNPIPPTIAATSMDLNRFGGELGEEYKSYIITGDFEFDLDAVNIQTILNYHTQRVGWVIDADGGAQTAVFASEFSTFDNFSVESRAATKFDGGINGVLGFYYQETKRDWRQEVIFAGSQNTAVADPADEFISYDKRSETDGETVSIYAELIWEITDQLELTGGARYIWEKKDSFFTQDYVNPIFKGRTGPDFTFGPGDGPAPLFVEGRFLADDRSADDLIPEITLRWQPNDDFTFWVAYKQGFKSGGFDNGSIDSTLNADAIGDITYDPEHVEGGEAGVKMSLADGAINLEFDVYHYKYNDLQLNFFNSTTFAYRTLNAGSAKTTGAELQVHWVPEQVEGLVLNASLAYSDARYGTFTAPCYSGQSPADGCPVQAGALKDQDLSGTRRHLAPKIAGNAGFNYTRPFGDGLEWGLSGNAKFKSKYLLNAFIPDAEQKGYLTLDAALRFGSEDGQWEFAVIGRNLTDKYILIFARDIPSTGGNVGTADAFRADRTGTPLNPRTIAFEATFRY